MSDKAKKGSADQRRMSRQQVSIMRAQGKLKLKDPEKEVLCRVTVQDISAYGMGLFIEQTPITPGAYLEIEFQNPHPLNLEARVIWVRAVSHNHRIIKSDQFQTRIGIEFENINKEQSEELKKFIQALKDPYFTEQTVEQASRTSQETQSGQASEAGTGEEKKSEEA